MSRALGFVGVLIVAALGFYIYTKQAQSVAPAGEGVAASPRATVDLAGVKNDLLAFANAEKQEYALDGKYLPLDDLRAKGTVLPRSQRGPFSYNAEVSDTSFRVVATYSGPDVAGVPKSMSIGDSMQIESQ